jgi:ribosomal protein S18 acetylase RimI-like enzyme
MVQTGAANDESPLSPVVIRVDEVNEITQGAVRTLIDIDLQTFSEPTFSHYTAASFLQSGHVYTLTVDSGVIGTCVFMRCWDRPGDANLLSMGILPGFRGQGLGQRFLLEVLDQLRECALMGVTLMVADDNRRARKVYSDAGFVETGVRYEDPRTNEGFIQLRVQLTEPLLAALPTL